MPSQFFGLSIAGSGLRNSNAALNTTANNISNVQTDGYSRQEVDSQAASALRTFTTYGCAGAGVETLAIERVRNDFYDVKYRNNNANYGQYEVKTYYMKTLEDYIKDDGDTGFVTVFNNMNSALQMITTNASSDSTKAQFVASASALTDYFNGLYGNLQELQSDINLEIKQCVDQINSISNQLATLNEQINVIELTGTKANDLRDRRDVLLDTLSEYVDVTTTENPIYDTNDPTRETGGSRFVVKIAGGQILVDSSDYSELKCVARDTTEKLNQSDIEGLYKITWDNGNAFSLTNASLNGKLRGLVELRDGNNGANFFGKVTSSSGTAGDTANPRKVNIKVSADNLKGLDECQLPEGGGEITIGGAIYYFDDWSFDGNDTYTFILDETKDNATKKIDVGADAKTTEAIKYQGIPYYMTQMNAFIRSFMKSVNNTFEAGINAEGKAGCNLFTGEKKDGSQLSQSELNGELYPEDGSQSPKYGYYWITAGNVTVNNELSKNAALLGSRSSADVGVEECGQVDKVISIMSNKNSYSFRNASANQMLELLLSDVALNSSNASTYEKTYKGLSTTIDNQRSSISGVDEDEEAVNLVKYQNAYTLASKMISTLSEIYDQLILSTGV